MSQTTPTETKLRAVFKAQQFRLRYPVFAIREAKKSLESILLFDIHQKMKSSKFSPKIIEATRIDNVVLFMETGFIDFDVISDYKSESGFNVSRAREEGTKDHRVPRFKFQADTGMGKVLHWIEMGKDFFSMGHWVSGIKEKRIIKNSVNTLTSKVQDDFDSKSQRHYDEMMGRAGR